MDKIKGSPDLVKEGEILRRLLSGKAALDQRIDGFVAERDGNGFVAAVLLADDMVVEVFGESVEDLEQEGVGYQFAVGGVCNASVGNGQIL
jgi:hypothetical protein